MPFHPTAYGPEVHAILALDGGGERIMPLVHGACSSSAALAGLKATSAQALFPESRAPEAAMAGLYLYFSCWDEAHQIAQDIDTPDGSYWHAIIHRQEPDDSNSQYWFYKTGFHPIYPRLAAVTGSTNWDSFTFVQICSQARLRPGSDLERLAQEQQLIEWQLLFDFCAAKPEPA